MKIRIVLLVLLVICKGYGQQTINFGSDVSTGTYSTSGAWSTSGGFIFEVGVFNAGFTPTAGNVSQWADNWAVANQGGASGSATWIDDGGDTYFTGVGKITTLGGAFQSSVQVYIWGYDSKAVGTRQWVLLTATTWLVASDISSPVISNFITNASTTAVVGSVSGNGTVFQSAQIVVSAVPEPGTYAAIIGLVSLGFCAARRRRRA